MPLLARRLRGNPIMDEGQADGALRLIIVSAALITGLLLLAGCAQVNADITKLPAEFLAGPIRDML
ncbi:MAG TPA: hypothetical protein VK548_24610 [Candidatus Acidoferrum sp.]|nr:hypothetical protein [Candidatus Acidoferrum sp.]